MRAPTFVLLTLGSVSLSCAGGTATSAPSAGAVPAVAADASSFSAHGLTVQRPDGWRFVSPDSTVPPDIVAMLQGPAGSHALAPVVEIARRPLGAADSRTNPERILVTTALELQQTAQGFDLQASPTEITLAGNPASVLRATVTELLPTGEEEKRALRIYATVHGSQVWLVRCMGPQDGSADADFDAVVGSLAFAQP